MLPLQLFPHPDFPSMAISAIRLDVGRREGGWLTLTFEVEGDLEQVLWPEFAAPAERADELWKHSCFEAFVGFTGEPGYCEFNVATSAKWAAYWFDGYRDGMRSLDDVSHAGHWSMPPSRMQATFLTPNLAAPREWHLGASVVIEAKDGTKSYWALAHAPGPPDFHNPDCFIATLPAPDTP